MEEYEEVNLKEIKPIKINSEKELEKELTNIFKILKDLSK